MCKGPEAERAWQVCGPARKPGWQDSREGPMVSLAREAGANHNTHTRQPHANPSPTLPTCKREALPPACKASGKITCGRCTIHGRLNCKCTTQWLSMQCPGLKWGHARALHQSHHHSWVPGASEEVVNAPRTRQWPVASPGAHSSPAAGLGRERRVQDPHLQWASARVPESNCPIPGFAHL